MKQVIPIMLSVLLAFSTSGVISAEGGAMKGQAQSIATVSTHKSPSFMFVLQAKEGEIMQNKAGQPVLVLRKTDIDHVIQFSDRPYRIVKYISGQDLAAYWRVGEDSFKVTFP